MYKCNANLVLYILYRNNYNNNNYLFLLLHCLMYKCTWIIIIIIIIIFIINIIVNIVQIVQLGQTIKKIIILIINVALCWLGVLH